MFAQWALFIASTIVAYLGISWFAQLTGGASHSALGAFLAGIRPLPVAIVVISNMFFGLALFYGFGITRFAIPATISLGVITSFVYSALVFGAQVTLTKMAGVLVVIGGVVLLAL